MSEHSNITATEPLDASDGVKDAGGSERRIQQRFPFTADAEVTEHRSRARVTGRCSDLGPGGCYVDTLAPFAVGAEVRICVTRDSSKLEAAAVITYAQSSLGMGLKFTEISGENRDVLNTWVSELSGAPPAAPLSTPAGAGSAATDGNTNMLIVLNQLIALLVRKKILTEKEGAGFLRKMFQ